MARGRLKELFTERPEVGDGRGAIMRELEEVVGREFRMKGLRIKHGDSELRERKRVPEKGSGRGGSVG